MKRFTRSFPVLLAVCLQVFPLLRNLVLNPAHASVLGFILRAGIGAGAVVGSVDAVSGATVVSGPILTVTDVPAGLQVSNALFTLTGTVSDIWPVSEVQFSLDGVNWQVANSTDNFATWSADLSLAPGQNVVRIYATDYTGATSRNGYPVIYYALKETLTVSTNGSGRIAPALNGAALQMNQSYTLTATPAAGFVLQDWTDSNGTIVGKNLRLTFVMTTNLALTANFIDVQKPVASVTNLHAGGSVSNALFTVCGTAADNDRVASLYFDLNNAGWLGVNTTNQFTNWWADVTLVPGKNMLAYYAMDPAGNISTTNTVAFSFVLSAPLLVSTNGRGSVAPNYNHALLAVSNRYAMTATPSAGFGFKNWTDANDQVVTNKPTLSFLMASNLAFTANFVDITRPTLTITNPVAATIVISNEFYAVNGKAADNVGLAAVWYVVNGSAADQAYTEDAFTDWEMILNLVPGTNYLAVYASDASGNISATNKITILYRARTQSSLNGLDLSVQSDSSRNGIGSELIFGATTFNLYSADTNNLNAVGTYTYSPLTQSNGILQLNYTAPPSATNAGMQTISLALETTSPAPNPYGRYTNGVDTGNVSFFPLPARVFPTLLNQNVLLVDAAGTATRTQFGTSQFATVNWLTGVTNRGTSYTNNLVSPDGALTRLARTNAINYLVTTWRGTNYGWAYEEDYAGTNLATAPAIQEFCLTSQRVTGNAPLTLNHQIAQFGLSETSERWLYFQTGSNFLDVTLTPAYATNGVGTYTYTRQNSNTGKMVLDYTSPVGNSVLTLQFVAPNFSIYTNDTGTISTLLWR